MKKKRIWELDFLRGFAIIMMVFDHLMYDFQKLNSIFSNFRSIDNPIFNWLYDIARLYWFSDLRFVGHMFFITLFITVSGISYTFSKSNLRRGIMLLGVALLINLVTFLSDLILGTDIVIVFGIIHMYAISILVVYLFRKIWNNDRFIFILGASIIILGVVLEFWELRYLSSFNLSDLPSLIIGTKAYGSDSFGIIPYVGIMMIGTVLGNSFYHNRVSLVPTKKITNKNFVNWVGRNSLIIFLTHQFVLYGLILVIGYLFGYRI